MCVEREHPWLALWHRWDVENTLRSRSRLGFGDAAQKCRAIVIATVRAWLCPLLIQPCSVQSLLATPKALLKEAFGQMTFYQHLICLLCSYVAYLSALLVSVFPCCWSR